MAHLLSFREGWQSENLARYLLSKFAFIAHPSTVGDDIGSDFFCTLFKLESINGHDFLMPLNSLMMQIKSNANAIDISDKIDFFWHMELPFFVGIVNKDNLVISVYSGIYLDLAFVMAGKPKSLKITLHDLVNKGNCYEYGNSREEVTVKFPKVTDIYAGDDPKSIGNKVDAIYRASSLMLRNKASRIMQEYILDFGDNDVRIFAGIGSAETFRRNFYYRLAEVFRNMIWIKENKPDCFSKEEFEVFKEMYQKLKEHDKEFPQGLQTLYETTVSAVEKK